MCLGDFAIAGMFTLSPFSFKDYQPETLRYMAPERASNDIHSSVVDPTKESDVYSFAMTSFSVCTYLGNHPTTHYHHPVTIRSSRGCYHITEVTAQT